MRALLTGILVGVLCCFSSAQDVLSLPHTNDTASRNQDSEGTNSSSTKRKTDAERIAAGSVILVELTRTIDAKKTKNGDAVEAKVTQDLKASHGEIVVPKNTEVTGHITETQARSKEQKESEVGIAFDHVLMKNGSSETLPMSIQAVIAPTFLNASGPANNNTDENTSSPTVAPEAGGNLPGNRSAGMGTSGQTTTPTSSDNWPPSPESQKAHPPITGHTQGVLGIPNLKLSTSANSAQGSVLVSEKRNVKLESGTLILLRVN